MPEELGAHANAAREREAALATRLHTTTQLDRAFVATLRGAAQVALRGRRRLDGIEAEIRRGTGQSASPGVGHPRRAGGGACVAMD
ncbi:DUF4226 domain-containing protein [Mycolicibacter algericus]|uniref:DUF4226 domain-containing protein n=1 Tax=Mycolicibacter algericus TaxID=1288388 RepID=UPI003C75D0AF